MFPAANGNLAFAVYSIQVGVKRSRIEFSKETSLVGWIIYSVERTGPAGARAGAMEVRWAMTARELAHSVSSQAVVKSRNRAAAALMSSNRLGVCWVQVLAATSQTVLFSTEDWLRESSGVRFPRVRKFHLTSDGHENNTAGSRLSTFGKRRVFHRGFGGRDSSSRFKEILIWKLVRALSSGKGEGAGNGQTHRTKASSETSSSQSTSPVSTSSSTTTTIAPKTQLGILTSIVSLPSSIWRQLILPLSNFGFGKTSVWEGGVGLFVISGAVLLAIALTWVKGTQLRSKSRKYEAVIEFARAQGITVGTPVRIRGVDVGSVVGMKPSLERIDVVVQVGDEGIVIPRNSLVENNQSGLISETIIDVTPRDPLPQPTVGPLDPGCSEEGLIVCNRERIKGEQGVSMDELVGICTKLAKQMDDLGMANMYDMAERVTGAIDEAKPLLGKVEILARDIEPLLNKLKGGGLLKDLERLAKVLTDAGDDLRTLNKLVLTTENTELLRQSVVTLTKTLTHIESISQDVSGLTGDIGTKKNLRQLIESLSRLIRD